MLESPEQKSSLEISPPMKASSADTVLASLYRSILVDLNFNMHSFSDIVGNYVNSPLTRITKPEKNKSSDKGNTIRELLADKITWKVFCKGLRVINIWKFKITIEAFHDNGTVTMHSKVVYINKEPQDDSKLPFDINI